MKRTVMPFWVALVALMSVSACGPGVPTTSAPASLAPSQVGGSAAPATSTPTATAPIGRDVLITVLRDPTDSLEVMVAIDLATGTAFRVPWYGPGVRLERDLAWSPDGGSVAMTRGVTVDSPRGPMNQGRIVIYEMDATEPSIEFAGDAHGPIWSSDGGAIAGWFLTESGDVGTVAWWRDGREVIRIPNSQPVSWVPGRSKLAVRLAMNQQIALVDLDTGAVEPLEVFVGSAAWAGALARPEVVWAPDGASFAFIAGSDLAGELPGCRVCRYDVATRSTQPIMPDPGYGVDIIPIAWPADGSLLVVTATETAWALARVDAVGKLQVLDEFDYVSRPILSPDGTRLAYMQFERADGAVELIVFSLADGTRSVVPDGGWSWNMLPIWRPAAAPLTWEPFEFTGPTPAPTAAAGFELVSHGAIEVDTTFAASCERGDGLVRVTLFGDVYWIQLHLLSDGTVGFLGIAGPDFSADAGKGFEARPPSVVLAPGATVSSGSLTFTDLPGSTGTGTISGRLSWTCDLR